MICHRDICGLFEFHLYSIQNSSIMNPLPCTIFHLIIIILYIIHIAYIMRPIHLMRSYIHRIANYIITYFIISFCHKLYLILWSERELLLEKRDRLGFFRFLAFLLHENDFDGNHLDSYKTQPQQHRRQGLDNNRSWKSHS